MELYGIKLHILCSITGGFILRRNDKWPNIIKGVTLAILFGFLTRTTALFTAGFTLLTAFLFHSNFAEGVNSLMFMKNLTISGGFLLLAITGPGAYSIDRLLNKKW